MKKRQNDKTAITLFKASYRCLRNERIAKYVMIVLSFGICLAAILNKYLPQIFPNAENIHAAQETAATYINLISGVILVAGIVVGFYTTRMHTEGTVLRDRYDSYVFDNPPNLAILRPIAQTVINVYAQKTKKKSEAFTDLIFDEEPDPDTAQFDYINREAHSDYRLYISVQPFFMTLWIGFCILIIIIAVTFNDSFVTTLINIMIPSLSAITTIGNSWYNCRLQMKQLQNLLTVIDQIQRLPDEKRLIYIKDKRNMRALADGLFNYRVSPFVIPNFLVRRHIKNSSGETVSIQLTDEKHPPKTEMPTLVLPDLDAAAPEIRNVIRSEIRTVSFSPTHTVDEVNAVANKRTYKRKTPDRQTPQSARQTPPARQAAQPAAEKPPRRAQKSPTEPTPPAARTKKPAAPAAAEKPETKRSPSKK